ncbi:PPE domain-containing protein [Allosaccharopolyspora coralli]|uniref:PPE domain-containing protein n=1 Tax=Allosaccharopolyspora coralli TaxID=2665642 RepID=A0A5Q3QDV7_9PSEU|nr:PPE domain-containing protein [Allosaccharopolyspora coralli]QGK69685.1 PPE domain-containing protein [Allosaccharopolyspora coralli]
MGNGRSLEPSNFEGASLEQMRGWVQSGAGAESMNTASEDWAKEHKFLMDLAQEVKAELDGAKVSFQSQSGEAMQNAMSPVVLWTEVAAESANVQSTQMNAQGEAFKTVESSIPAKSEEQEVPDDNFFEEGFDSMFNGGTDAEKANAANEKLRQEGVRAFDAYGSASSGNVEGSATFTPPPEQGMNTAINQGSHTSVGQMQTASAMGASAPAASGSSWAAGGSSGGGSVAPMGGGAGGVGGSAGAGGTGGVTPGQTNPNYVGTAPGGGGQSGPGANGPGGSGSGPGRGGGAGVLPGAPGTGGGSGGRGGSGAGGRGGVGSGGRSGSGTGAGPRGGAGSGSGTGTGAGRGGSGALGSGGRGGVGGFGSGGGTGSGGGLGAGGQSGVGRGGMSGVGGSSGVAGQGGATAAGGRGGTVGAMGGAGARGAQGEEDDEHYTPEFLKGDYGFFDEDLPKVAPPVFGDWENK